MASARVLVLAVVVLVTPSLGAATAASAQSRAILAPVQHAVPVTRAEAITTVVDSIILPDPGNDLIRAYCLQDAICSESVVFEAIGGDTLIAPADSGWFVWIDESSYAKFSHDTRYVFVDGTSGDILHDVAGLWWPSHNGTELYGTFDERATSSDLFWDRGTQVDGGSSASPPPTLRGDPMAPPSSKHRAADTWGIIISPWDFDADPAIGQDILDMREAFDSLGVSHDLPIVEFSLADTKQAIEDLPNGCDKLYVYWTGHGAPGSLAFPPRGGQQYGDCFSSHDLACMLEDQDADEYCIIVDTCHSASFLHDFADKGLTGLHITSSPADRVSYMFNGTVPFTGSWMTSAFADCIKAGARGIQAVAWADSAVDALRDSLITSGNGWPGALSGGTSSPVGGYAGKFTGPGGTGSSGGGGGFEFEVAQGCSTVCIDVASSASMGQPNGNVSLFCQINGAWQLSGTYNFATGPPIYFRAFETAGANGIYNLSMHANHLGGRVLVTWTGDTSTPVTGTVPNVLDAASIGWTDGTSDEFRFDLGEGVGGPYELTWEEGTLLDEVPAKSGPNHFDDTTFEVPIEIDLTHLELYENSDPGQGFADDTSFLFQFAHVLDPFTGTPGGTSTFEATAFQPSLGTVGPFVGQFTDPSGPGPRSHGTINAPALVWNVGKIFPEPIRLTIRTLGPNVIEWDAIFMLPGLGVGVDVPEIPLASAFLLRPAAPNPFRSATGLRFALKQAGRVRLEVYDVTGRRVRTLVDGWREAGEHLVPWDARHAAGSPVAAGVYFVRMEAGGASEARPVVHLR